MATKNFHLREWLNPIGQSSSGSVMAFHGKAPWKSNRKMLVLEVADCHGKVRLHRADTDSKQDFINKLITLRTVIDKFIAHLEGE